MRFSLWVSLGIALAAGVSAAPPEEKPKWVSSKKFQKDIKEKGSVDCPSQTDQLDNKLTRGSFSGRLMGNLASLYDVALKNGGNRAFGYPGYDASVDFIWGRIKKAKNYKIWKQDVPGLWNKVESITFRVGETDYYVFGLTYSPSTTPEGVTAPLVLGPEGTAACTVDGYANLDVKGKMVLVERGTCPDKTTIAGRIRAGAAAGASNVILYNNIPTKVTGGTLSKPDPVGYVSSGFINQVDGQSLREKLLAGEQLTAYFQQTQLIEEKITQNVFAETKGGDPENVVMLGAHLDGVLAGPGINDDGSGTSLILELMTALDKYKVKNKVRFAWWAAEENGLVGSRYYTANLKPEEISNLLAYLNFDMVSRGYYGVFDGDGSTHGLAGAPGSDVIEKIFVDDLTSKGINVTAAIFTGGSDYASFMDVLKKPIGGLHTGTGIEQDACYHQECDTYDNANPETLTINAKTAANTLAILAMEGEKLIPKAPGNNTSVVPRAIETFEWTVMEGERHLSTCGHEI